MDTKKIKAADLCSPVDLGSQIRKGSLVRRDGVTWRVQAVRETHPGHLEIRVREERSRRAERHELTSPRSARWPVKATDMFDVVVEDVRELYDPAHDGLKSLPETKVYGFEVTGENADAARNVLRFLGAWVDRQPDPPHRSLSLTGDGATFGFRAERTNDGCRLFRDAHREVARQEGQFRLRVFEGSRMPMPPPGP